MSSCALICEGLDIPDVGAAILLRPTASLNLYLQQVGRALRPKPDGVPAIILDHAGNELRHGHPAEPRLWSLEGHPAREAAEREERESEEQQARPEAQDAELADEADGQLVPLTSGQFDPAYLRHIPLRAALRLCATEADVRQLGRVRGYRPGWAWHVLRERQTKAVA